MVQRALSADLVASVSYVGNMSRHLTTYLIPTTSGGGVRAILIRDPFKAGGAPDPSNPGATCAASWKSVARNSSRFRRLTMRRIAHISLLLLSEGKRIVIVKAFAAIDHETSNNLARTSIGEPVKIDLRTIVHCEMQRYRIAADRCGVC